MLTCHIARKAKKAMASRSKPEYFANFTVKLISFRIKFSILFVV